MLTLADGGIETTLIDRFGCELPEFAAFVLLDLPAGCDALAHYYRSFADIARAHRLPLSVDTPTWRAQARWGELLGVGLTDLSRLNTAAARLTREWVSESVPTLAYQPTIGGCVGPIYDDFIVDQRRTAAEYTEYHSVQVSALAAGGVDHIVAVTMIDAAEAIGVVRAAHTCSLPVIISFTVNSEGFVPCGGSLGEVIAQVDAATAGLAAAVYVNCAHPDEVDRALTRSVEAGFAASLNRVTGLRLNAARHDASDTGDPPEQFAHAMNRLRARIPQARVFGGCCGTDVPHISAVAELLHTQLAH